MSDLVENPKDRFSHISLNTLLMCSTAPVKQFISQEAVFSVVEVSLQGDQPALEQPGTVVSVETPHLLSLQ